MQKNDVEKNGSGQYLRQNGLDECEFPGIEKVKLLRLIFDVVCQRKE